MFGKELTEYQTRIDKISTIENLVFHIKQIVARQLEVSDRFQLFYRGEIYINQPREKRIMLFRKDFRCVSLQRTDKIET